MARTPKADYLPLVIEAARRRLLEGEEVTVASIAAELDISPSLVHFYAGNRQEIVASAWRSILASYVDTDQQTIVAATQAGDWEIVAELIRVVFARERDHMRRAHVRVVAESFHNEFLRELVDEEARDTVRSWLRILRAAQGAGVISTSLDLEAIARLIVGVPLGITAQGIALTPKQRKGVAEAWSSVLRAALRPDVS